MNALTENEQEVLTSKAYELTKCCTDFGFVLLPPSFGQCRYRVFAVGHAGACLEFGEYYMLNSTLAELVVDLNEFQVQLDPGYQQFKTIKFMTSGAKMGQILYFDN